MIFDNDRRQQQSKPHATNEQMQQMQQYSNESTRKYQTHFK